MRILIIITLVIVSIKLFGQWNCGDTLIDTRDGKSYPTVLIDTQCWLGKNMNIGIMVLGDSAQIDNSIIEKYCYNNDTNNCNIYGGLYQWAEMVQYYNGVTNTTHWSSPVPTVVQGICPEGWHIPTTTEFDALATYFGSSVVGGSLKDTTNNYWGNANGWVKYGGACSYVFPNVGATNSSGFTALPHGHIYLKIFKDLHEYGNYWTITKGQTNTDAY